MEPAIAQRLIEVNQRFYQSFASAFAETRGRNQPGVLRVLEGLPPQANILDLGCGNGNLAAELVERGFQGRYVGVDSSDALIEIAKGQVQSSTSKVLGPRSDVQRPTSGVGDSERPVFEFLQADLTAEGWAQESLIRNQQFDYILAFAVLHHLPGAVLRERLLEQVGGLLAPGGQFIHSNWQFLNSARLRGRIQPWERIGLAEEDVDEGDYLLDWRRDGEGLRYVHHFSEEELAQLAERCGFEAGGTFYSDGEGGRLGLYGEWGKEKG